MTFQEAMATAMRELGKSEAEIEERRRFATGMLPEAKELSQSHKVIMPGKERELIDFLKHLYTDYTPEQLRALLIDNGRKIGKNN